MKLEALKIDYQPAIISVEEKENFEKNVLAIAEQYKGYVVTAGTIKDDKQVRTELNKIYDAIETRRKEIKGNINSPYDEFKKWYDEAIQPLVDVREAISKAIKEYDEHVKKMRAEAVKSVFKQLAEASNLSPEIFEVYHANFVKAEHFKKTAEYELTNKAIFEINKIFEKEQKAHNERLEAQAAIIETCADYNLFSNPYLQQFNNGVSLTEILKQVRADAKAKEEAKKKAEAEARKKAEEEAKKAAEAKEAEAAEETAEDGKERKFFKKKKDKKDEKIEELTDRLTRQMAEFDNFRKRTEKEKANMYAIGAKDIIEKILPVVDSFERGLATVENPEEDPFADGMNKVYKQFTTALDELGVTVIEAVGKEFDPNLHNAVMHVEDEEAGENIVVEEFMKGYMYKGSVVRHSMVKVAN